jgi:hypothetical protein
MSAWPTRGQRLITALCFVIRCSLFLDSNLYFHNVPYFTNLFPCSKKRCTTDHENCFRTGIDSVGLRSLLCNFINFEYLLIFMGAEQEKEPSKQLRFSRKNPLFKDFFTSIVRIRLLKSQLNKYLHLSNPINQDFFPTLSIMSQFPRKTIQSALTFWDEEIPGFYPPERHWNSVQLHHPGLQYP